MKKWKKVSSRYAFKNPWMMIRQDTVELPNGKILDDYFVYEEGDVTMIVPVTENGDFVLVKQYKHAVGEIVIEFPAGYVNKGETPIQTAERELKEETGYESNGITRLAQLTNAPTKVVSDIYVYLALNSKPSFHPTENQDENENIELLILPFEKVHEMIKTGQIKVTGTVSSFYLASEKLGLIK
jgi:8-oxo-dGTP pyrophosphatase MutT (NUDIX family)